MNTGAGVTLLSTFSTVGLLLANVTVPGPRNLLHDTVTGADLRPWLAERGSFTSSATHMVRASALPVVVVSEVLLPRGPCTPSFPSSKLTNGGVFPLASMKGETSHRGFRLIGITVVWPLATIVHVSFLFPKSFGTITVKTPH